MKLLLMCLLATTTLGCGKKKDMVGSWSGRCERDDTTPDKTEVDCAVEIGAPKDNVYPVHATAGSGEMECDAEATVEEDKYLAVSAPKHCKGLGSRGASWRMFMDDGRLTFRGLFLGSGAASIRFSGALDRGETKSAPSTSSAAPASGGPAAPPPTAPMAPPSAPPAAPPKP